MIGRRPTLPVKIPPLKTVKPWFISDTPAEDCPWTNMTQSILTMGSGRDQAPRRLVKRIDYSPPLPFGPPNAVWPEAFDKTRVPSDSRQRNYIEQAAKGATSGPEVPHQQPNTAVHPTPTGSRPRVTCRCGPRPHIAYDQVTCSPINEPTVRAPAG